MHKFSKMMATWRKPVRVMLDKDMAIEPFTSSFNSDAHILILADSRRLCFCVLWVLSLPAAVALVYRELSVTQREVTGKVFGVER